MENNTPETKRSNKKTTLVIVCALCALVIAFAAIWLATRPQAQQGQKAVAVSVAVGEEAAQEFAYHTDAATLGELLLGEGLAQGETSTYGLFIQTVNGVTADDALQQWWCLTKGGEMVMTGADTTPLADGEHYELTLKTGW